MPVSLRRQWEHFTTSPAGRRFEARYRLRRARRYGVLRRTMISGVGVVLMLAGLAMLVLPGPGALVLIIGAALIAEESLAVARILDRMDGWMSGKLKAWRASRESSA